MYFTLFLSLFLFFCGMIVTLSYGLGGATIISVLCFISLVTETIPNLLKKKDDESNT